MSDAFVHVSVLPLEITEAFAFAPEHEAILIDGTLGGGGHSGRLLQKYPKLRLLGIDRDDRALTAAARHLEFAADRITLVKGNFSDMAEIAKAHNIEEVDGVLLDIGVSSPQLDHAERGFSWRHEAPLDMRMDQSSPLTASRYLNHTSEAELERILRVYGEVRKSRKMAAAIVAARTEKPLASTGDLVKLCDEVLGRSRPGELPAPTLVFQALRIAVNDELSELEAALPQAVKLLKKGGRLAVISFHSLEDRIVKNFIRDEGLSCVCPPQLPVCMCNKKPTLLAINRKVITASDEELAQNRRSAPAKLRIAEKI